MLSRTAFNVTAILYVAIGGNQVHQQSCAQPINYLSWGSGLSPVLTDPSISFHISFLCDVSLYYYITNTKGLNEFRVQKFELSVGIQIDSETRRQCSMLDRDARHRSTAADPNFHCHLFLVVNPVINSANKSSTRSPLSLSGPQNWIFI